LEAADARHIKPDQPEYQESDHRTTTIVIDDSRSRPRADSASLDPQKSATGWENCEARLLKGFEAAAAAAPELISPVANAQYGQPGHCPKRKGSEQLFAGVFERGTDDIDRRIWARQTPG